MIRVFWGQLDEKVPKFRRDVAQDIGVTCLISLGG
jgi:hypothetical protein